MGIPANWDLWVYLFRGELHTIAMGERGMRRAVRVGGLTLTLRDTCKELYLLCTMTSNNADWERRLFYLHNDSVGLPPYFGKVLMGKPDAWFHGVSPPSWNQRLESLTTALRHLADTGLGAASIIFNFHHRRIVPLMERDICIFEMSDAANPHHWHAHGCCRSASLRSTRPHGRGAQSTSRWCRTTMTTVSRL
jgi:hypothetical protein